MVKRNPKRVARRRKVATNAVDAARKFLAHEKRIARIEAFLEPDLSKFEQSGRPSFVVVPGGD